MIKQEILELLKNTDQGVIYSFIAKYAEDDKNFYTKIKEELLPNEKDVDEEYEEDEEEFDLDYYRDLANDCFEIDSRHSWHRGYDYYELQEAAYKAAAELNELIKDAKDNLNQRNFATAASIVISIVEKIAENEENVDDSDGELRETLDNAVELLCKIIIETSVPDYVKKLIYDWVKKEVNSSIYTNYGYDEIKNIYKICCEQLGNVEEVLAEIDKEINETDNEYSKSEAVLWKIRFMQAKNIDIQNVIDKYIEIDDVRKIYFQQLMKNKEYDNALVVAKKGLEIAQNKKKEDAVLEWKKSLFDIYTLQGDTDNVLEIGEFLFLNSGWKYKKEEFYEVLKKYTPSEKWQDTLERLISENEKENCFKPYIANIMRDNQLWKRFFEYCKRASIENIISYEQDLKHLFENEIFELYLNYVEEQALITSQYAYESIANILKRMKTFTGGDVIVRQLVQKYRQTYKRRRNMMAELSKIID